MRRMCNFLITALIAGVLYSGCLTPVDAQNIICATRPFGDNTNSCASTAFVQNALAPLPTGLANPTGLIGMTAVNGVLTTAERSDSTHAIDPAIAPTWTGIHRFSNATASSSPSTGAIVISTGGLGVDGSIYAGSTISTQGANAGVQIIRRDGGVSPTAYQLYSQAGVLQISNGTNDIFTLTTAGVLSLGVSGTSAGSLILFGSASGSLTQAVQNAASTPTVTWGTSSGTPAVTASTPLGITAATGNITCATCVTSSGGGAISGTAPIAVSAAGVVSINTPYVSLTASNGGIVYSGATNLAILAGTATARQMLQSGASTTPAWSTTTWPATATVNRLLYASATNVIGDLATANSSILVTDGSGVPSLSTTLPAHTLGGSISGNGQTITNLASVAIRDTSAAFDVTIAATSSAALSAGRTLTLNIGNVAHTLAFGTTANTITFPNVASDTVAMLGATQTFTGINTFVRTDITVGTTFQTSEDSANAGPQVSYFRNSASPAANDSLGQFLFQGKNSGASTVPYGAVTAYILSPTAGTHAGAMFFQGTTAGGLLDDMQVGNGVMLGYAAGTAPPGVGSLQVNVKIFAPNLATTTAALGAALCWTVTTGEFQRDTNAGGCLVSAGRYKHDVADLLSGLGTVMAMRPVSFLYNDNVGIAGPQVGFIADEMATVEPRLVGFNPDGSAQSVRYMQLTAVLTRAVQELKADNDNLRVELARVANGR